ncbi:glycoside hydrolase family 2 TIM barrel-domain containing protein [Olivibacter sp. XZL3]|uniref:glycoside hydrolase family 2 protein n=1 Tax=Olivibacter sp. XZL3 TaxID=1735116 RepID=UPI001F11915B|nr:glycoside hydrolase family 2 TIM barrel-domain containing protein [Olivibacter sp. XZL3]
MSHKIFLLFAFMTLGLYTAFSQEIEKQVQYLSGTDNEHTVEWDFWCSGGRKSGKWGKIAVPAHWEQQGYGDYNYGRDYVTYGKNFRFHDEKGVYRHTFSVNDQWKGKKVFIVFEGVMTDAEVKINGQSAGPIHQGAFYRFRYDISDKLRYGKDNQLEVTVSKMSADPSVNNAERLADYWILGGIFRPVYLEIVPPSFIDYVAIDAKADGSFHMQAHIGGASEGLTLKGEIIDKENKRVGTLDGVLDGKDSILSFNTKVSKPALWTAETPNRYTLKASLYRDGALLYVMQQKFGFRTIEIRKQDGIYLNGTKIKMKGVNRHVWWPETGRSVNADIDLADVKLMKYMNMNAVRCSHYPPDQSFLDICDSLGLYVLDELAGWQKAYATPVGSKLVKEMVVRDLNHPSIIFWSNGNEGGHNFDLDSVFHQYDLSKRPVIHAHHRPGNAFNGIDCNHYEDFYSTQNILADTNIYMPTEFLHAQDDGGGAAGLADIWELHWNAKKGAGGFLWALVDEGLVRTDEGNIIDVNGVNAPDGLVGPHREHEGSVNAIREIYSPIKVQFEKLPVNFDGHIPLENRFHFTNLNRCTFEWQLLNFDTPLQEGAGFIPVASGTGAFPNIAPLKKGTLRLKLPVNWSDQDALALTAFDPEGNEIYRWVYKVKPNRELAIRRFDEPIGKTVELKEQDSLIEMTANGITVGINKQTGRLARLANAYSKDLSFKDGPILVSGEARPVAVNYYSSQDTAVVEASYEGDLKYIKWKMDKTGWLEMDYAYALSGDQQFAGVSFSYPENYVLGVKWLGKGPYRVWKNRPQGTTYNVWKNRNNNTQTGSFPWIFPEFKGYYADVTWMEMNTVEGKFYLSFPSEDLYVRLFDFYGLTGIKPHPDLPVGNVSFLDAIPPIGTKLALNMTTDTKRLGPQSELNHLDGKLVERKVYFYFGTPKVKGENKQFEMPKVNVLTD